MSYIGLSERSVKDGASRLRRMRARRVARAAKVAGMTMATGTLAVALVAPQAFPTGVGGSVALELALTGSGSAFQPLVDQILATQQQIMTQNAGYPFITDFDKTLLPTYATNLGRLELFSALGALNRVLGYNQDGQTITYSTNAPGAEQFVGPNTWNPDQPYFTAVIANQTATLTVRPGPGTLDTSFALSPGNGANGSLVPGININLHELTPNADGSYTIYLSPTEHSGNWIDTGSGMSVMLARATNGDWGLPHTTWSLSTGHDTIVPVLTNAQIGAVLTQLPAMMTGINNADFAHGLQEFENTIPANAFLPIGVTPTLVGPAAPGQLSSFGRVELEPNQALVVKVPDVEAGYTGFQISDAWTQDLPYVKALGSLNNTQAFHGTDGFTYYVISDKDPGVANWIDTSGHPDSVVMARFMDVTGATPTTPITTQVVNIADVRDYLPSDMPTVTAAERAAELQTRILEFNYLMDQYKNNAGWLTQHLEFDQVRNAVGSDQFDALFGVQPDVPSVLDRMIDPTLMPDLNTVFQAVLADPAGSLSAVVQNLPLLTGDIMWPMILAALRVDLLLADAPAASTFETILSQTFIDPASSITAGFLNARDDLAVSLMNSGSYDPLTSADLASVWGSFLTMDQSASQALSEGFALLTPGAGDAASAVAGLVTDLLP